MKNEIRIAPLTLQSVVDIDHAEFHVVCDSGLYVRTLAEDIAKLLGTVGYAGLARCE